MKRIIFIVAMLLSNGLYSSDLSRLIVREVRQGANTCYMQDIAFLAKKFQAPFDREAVENSSVWLAVSNSGERFPLAFISYGLGEEKDKITAFIAPFNDVAVVQKLMSKLLELGVGSLVIEHAKENPQETDLLCRQGFRVKEYVPQGKIVYRWQRT